MKAERNKQRSLPNRKLITANDKRRYKLHRKLREAEIRYYALKRTIYIPWDQELQNEFAISLQQEFNYCIQTEIT